MKKFIVGVLSVLLCFGLMGCGTSKEDLEKIEELTKRIEDLEAENDYLKNGAAALLSKAKTYFESGEYGLVIDTVKELHEKFNGTTEDIEGQEISKESVKIIDKLETAEKAEASKSALDKMREAISVTNLICSKPSSVGGVDISWTFINKSNQAFKYVSFLIEAYNAVDDAVECEIRGESARWLKYTGPCKVNGFFDVSVETVWYNSTIKSVKLLKVKIEYMDGTTADYSL